MQALSLLGLFVAPTLATKLLLPLYQYPEDGSWDSIYETIQGNPGLTFQVILNVDSGPGSSSNSGPNSDFASATAKLNAFPNVQTLGYVHTLFGEASQDDVNANVSAWHAWNTYTQANTSIHGIFFDEVHNTEGDDSDVTYMQALVDSALSTFASQKPTIVFNPGSKPEHLEFYDLADYVVVFETYASEYSNSVLSENVPSGYANQSAILIPDFASVGSASDAESWLKAMVDAGIASAHILNYDYLQSTSTDNPAAISSIASVLAAMQGSSSSASTITSSSGTPASATATTTISTTTTTTYTSATPDDDDEASVSDDEESSDNNDESGDDAEESGDDDGESDDDSSEETTTTTSSQATTLVTVVATATDASSTGYAPPRPGFHGSKHHHYPRGL